MDSGGMPAEAIAAIWVTANGRLLFILFILFFSLSMGYIYRIMKLKEATIIGANTRYIRNISSSTRTKFSTSTAIMVKK